MAKKFKDDYSTCEKKMAARIAAYKFFQQLMIPGPIQYLPCECLLETNIILKMGIPLHNHRVVECDMKKMKRFERNIRDEFGQSPEALGIQTKQMYLSQASWQWSVEGEFVSIANLDLCGNLDSPRETTVFAELDEWCASGIMRRGLLGVWVLSGREQRIKYARQGDQSLSVEEANQRRFATLQHFLSNSLAKSSYPRLIGPIDGAEGLYHNTKGSNNTMLWKIFEIIPKLGGK